MSGLGSNDRASGAARRFAGRRVLLFDLDGTLIQQRIDFGRMRAEVLAIAARYGLPSEALAGLYVLELIDRAQAALMARGGGRAEAFVREAQGAIQEIEIQAADTAAAFGGVPAMLGDLRQAGYAIGIVTRNCRAAVERVLARQSLPHDVLLTRDDVAHVKPDPRHLHEALAALGATGDQTIMCGDHPMDVLAGKRIGAATVGVLPPGGSAGHFDEVRPDLLLHAVTVLPAYLGHKCEAPLEYLAPRQARDGSGGPE